MFTNVARTEVLPWMVTVPGLVVPVSPPLQPEKAQPAAGVAVRVTTSPLLYAVLSGFFATVPLPAVVTVSEYWFCRTDTVGSVATTRRTWNWSQSATVVWLYRVAPMPLVEVWYRVSVSVSNQEPGSEVPSCQILAFIWLPSAWRCSQYQVPAVMLKAGVGWTMLWLSAMISAYLNSPTSLLS